LDAEPGGDPCREQRPERVGSRERDADPRVGQADEQEDHDPRPDQSELLADDREDVVVARVRQEQAAGQPALPETGPEEPAETEREEALDRVDASPGRIRPGGAPGLAPR